MQRVPDMRAKVASALVGALGLLSIACSGTSDDGQEDRIWRADSAGIDFTLTGAVAQHLCDFSATRAELTAAQLDGLSALRLHDGTGIAGCDIPSYGITIRAQDGSSMTYRATLTICQTSPIVLFDDFNAWAMSTPCSLPP